MRKLVVCVLWEMQHRWRSDGGFTNTSNLCQCCSQRTEKKSKWGGEGIMWKRRAITMPVGGGHPWFRNSLKTHKWQEEEEEETEGEYMKRRFRHEGCQLAYEAVLHTYTFLSHVVHTVRHSSALLHGVQAREASIVIYKEVICKKKKKRVNRSLCSKCQIWYDDIYEILIPKDICLNVY